MAARLLPVATAAALVALLAPAAAQDGTAFGTLLLREMTVANQRAPIDLRFGSFSLQPSLDITGTFDATDGEVRTIISPHLIAAFDPNPHSFRFSFDADYIPVQTSGGAQIPYARLAAGATLDLPGVWQLDLNGGITLSQQTGGDFDTPPRVRTLDAHATLQRGIGPFGLRLTTGVSRSTYGDGLVGGVPVEQDDLDALVLDANLRLSFNNGGRLTPYVEGGMIRRIHDNNVDSNGFLQDGTTWTMRGGVIYGGRRIQSELAVGYATDLPDEPTFDRVSTWTFDASVNWQSQRELFALSLRTNTLFNPDPANAGDPTREQTWTVRGTMQATEALQIGMTGAYSRAIDTVGGITNETSIGLDLGWQPREWIRITAGVTHNWLWAPDPLDNSAGTTFRVSAHLTPP